MSPIDCEQASFDMSREISLMKAENITLRADLERQRLRLDTLQDAWNGLLGAAMTLRVLVWIVGVGGAALGGLAAWRSH